MTPEQRHAVKQSYSDAFSESMKVCAALGALGVLASFVVYRRHPLDFGERRKAQLEEDRVRREIEGGLGNEMVKGGGKKETLNEV
jgi:hypothetical protein